MRSCLKKTKQNKTARHFLNGSQVTTQGLSLSEAYMPAFQPCPSSEPTPASLPPTYSSHIPLPLSEQTTKSSCFCCSKNASLLFKGPREVEKTTPRFWVLMSDLSVECTGGVSCSFPVLVVWCLCFSLHLHVL